MKFRRRPTLAGLAQVILLLLAPRAGVAATPANQITFDQVISKWTVAPDGTWVVEADVTIRAPKDNPSHVVRVPVTWSASLEKLQVISGPHRQARRTLGHPGERRDAR